MASVGVQDVAFSADCERAVLDFIRNSDEILGCMAWLTNPEVIEMLARMPKCRITVTADAVHNRPGMGLYRFARQVGRARGRFRALMHHKFLVRLTDGQPSHVLLGSYNVTRRSNANIGECVVVLEGEPTARRFANEAQRVWDEARPIRANNGRRR